MRMRYMCTKIKMTSPVILGFFVPGKNNKKTDTESDGRNNSCFTFAVRNAQAVHKTYSNRSEILLNGTCSSAEYNCISLVRLNRINYI